MERDAFKMLIKEAMGELIEERKDLFNALFAEAVEQYFSQSHQQYMQMPTFQYENFNTLMGEA